MTWEEFANIVLAIEPTANGCMEWPRGKYSNGYGRVQIGVDDMRAHRAAHMLFIGEIPPELRVLHSCDNPPCVSPYHFFLGTIADNNRDKMEKGRHPFRKPHPVMFTDWSAQHLEVERLGLEGVRDLEIWKTTGIDYSIVTEVFMTLGLNDGAIIRQWNVLCEEPIEVMKRLREEDPKLFEMRLLKQKGASYADLADRYGGTRQRIQQMFKPKAFLNGCVECGSYDQLQIHHLNYLSNACVRLCHKHHKKAHCSENVFGTNGLFSARKSVSSGLVGV